MHKDSNRKIIWSHINAYKSIDSVEITAVCDVNANTVTNIQNECQILQGYTDYNQMLENHKFDVVSICTPIQTHFDIIKKCVECGVKAIFCEKTLSYSVEEALEIKRLCEEHNVVLAVNYIFRWDKFINEVKSLLQSNAIGKIYSIVGYGATALHTSTSHLIDMILNFADDSKVEYVVGEMQTDFVRNVHGVPDHGGMGFFKFQSGIVTFLKGVSKVPTKYMFEIDILGEEGRIKLYNNGNSYDVYKYSISPNSPGSTYESMNLLYTKHNTEPNERVVEAIQELISCIDSGKAPKSNVDTAIQSIKIIDAIKESSTSKKMINFYPYFTLKI